MLSALSNIEIFTKINIYLFKLLREQKIFFYFCNRNVI